jgi:hypothetical protein
MSLLSTDITKLKRLSLEKTEAIKPILVNSTPTAEEIAYSKLVAKNPLLEKLVERLNLISETTGDKIKKVDLREEQEPPTEAKDLEPDKLKLIALAQRVIEPRNNYTRAEIIHQIIQTTKVEKERAERGFNLLLQAEAIEMTPGGSYYLTGSTPF